MASFNIEFYQKADGSEPAKIFVDSLNAKMRAKAVMMLDLLSKNGNNLREPYSKHVSDGIFELRTKVGSDISRVMYFFYVGHKIILTHGFVKKTQKTPPNEIRRAKQYRADYLRRESMRDEH